MKKGTTLLSLCLLGLASPFLLHAQSSVDSPPESASQVAGLREFTLGGGGATNKDFDDSMGSLEFSYGSFLSPRSELVLRQSFAYVNPDDGDSGWNGTSRLAYDYHLSSDAAVRPFVGVNAGRIYGDNVNDSWTAGLEVGAKFFVKAQTFIYTTASYDWLFDRGSDLNNRFDDGRIAWNVGIGYHF